MNFFKIFSATILAMIVSLLLFVVAVAVIISGAIVYFAPIENVTPESVLVIDLRETIVDTPTSNPLSMVDLQKLAIKQNITTLDAIRAIEMAANDDNIKGIYIRPAAGATAPVSTLEEIREEVERFKGSGKFVIAYSDSYSQGGYYLGSVADSVYLHREGMIVWQGVSANSLFFKGLLDKLDVNVELFRPSSCSYKSAMEPLTREDMSAESRAQSEALVESLWAAIIDDVSTSRRITPYELNEYASSLVSFIAEKAASTRLVDGLIYEDEVESVFEKLGVELGKEGRANRISLTKYSFAQKLYPTSKGDSPKVAVIYAEGEIVDGQGEVGDIGGDALARTIRKTRDDDKVKSVVLRVNSPGGSALAADVVWREMELLRAKKPVVVSMGSYAASGGYYISAPADVIVANKTSVTGSIGVYGVLLDIEGALSSKLGITSDSAKSNPSADFMHTSRPTTLVERKIMEQRVEGIYNTFTSHVAAGRNLPLGRVHEISAGRVYSGADAKKLGLVDAEGGLKSAIIIAANRGGVVDDFQVEEMSSHTYDISSLLSPIGSNIRQQIASHLKVFDTKGGVVMFSTLRVEM